MRALDRHLPVLLKRIKARGAVLMLDYDGVLAPLVKDPARARMSATTRRALLSCTAKMPVAIITGRTLSDIESRVAIKELVYAGDHGLEWCMHGRVRRKKLPQAARRSYAQARRALLALAVSYPQVLVEDKRFCLALGYRGLSQSARTRFRLAARAVLAEYEQSGSIRVVDNLFTFEILPTVEWSKGECARHIMKSLRAERRVPIYIGDSLTDENAFRALKHGVTIRVGASRASEALYYVASRTRVDAFLRVLGTP